jgi:hypothetical protein
MSKSSINLSSRTSENLGCWSRPFWGTMQQSRKIVRKGTIKGVHAREQGKETRGSKKVKGRRTQINHVQEDRK